MVDSNISFTISACSMSPVMSSVSSALRISESSLRRTSTFSRSVCSCFSLELFSSSDSKACWTCAIIRVIEALWPAPIWLVLRPSYTFSDSRLEGPCKKFFFQGYKIRAGKIAHKDSQSL